jgi:transcription initiation factor TFIIIB Brf1 subunit/transcription initiation factor TFIIB
MQVLIEPVLALVHLDNQFVSERVSEVYEKIYGDRRARKGFKKTEEKQRLALAFSILNTLNRQHMPRPVEDVLLMCGVSPKKENTRKLLNIRKTLSLTDQELRGLQEEDYELQDASPEDYVDVLCVQLGIPFAVASEIHATIAKAHWKLYGKRPPVIIAAAILHTVQRHPALHHVSMQGVCHLLNVTQHTAVSKTVASLAALDC